MQKFLLMADTIGVQGYLFGSNHLPENIGGSHLVAVATEGWVQELLNENTAQLLYAGGGNFAIVFDDVISLKNFARKLSRRILEQAPGVQLLFEYEPFGWDKAGELQAALGKLRACLNRPDRSWRQIAPLMGSGVTVMCRSTALPVTEVIQDDDKPYPISAEIYAKLQVALPPDGNSLTPTEVEERFRNMKLIPDGTSLPRDFDDLGREHGEYSYLAVIHADGNAMGQRFRNLGDGANLPSREYVVLLSSFSKALADATQKALSITIEKFSKSEGTKAENGRLYLRPLVVGGDDVTLVCDGRFGLSVAIEYLRQFHQATANLPDGKGNATASAGIAIVKTHYPFARAYELADELCKSAKQYLRKIDVSASGLDWHFAQGGLYGDLEAIRKREYDVPFGNLTLRPVTLEDTAPKRTWSEVEKNIQEVQQLARNKQKALREALRGGPDKVQRFCEIYGQTLSIPGGWYQEGGDARCAYFDALELADWYRPLAGG